jgi:hypothetical protein
LFPETGAEYAFDPTGAHEHWGEAATLPTLPARRWTVATDQP